MHSVTQLQNINQSCREIASEGLAHGPYRAAVSGEDTQTHTLQTPQSKQSTQSATMSHLSILMFISQYALQKLYAPHAFAFRTSD